MERHSKRVAIIGAGPSGLVAVKECLAAGLEVQCFERAHALGGLWLYNPDPGADASSAMYPGVILNSSRLTTGYSDFPIDPSRYPIYYSHRLHLRYLNEYAAHFALEKHIRYETTVVGCASRKEGGWEVRVRRRNGEDGNGEEVLAFDAVICGTGIASKPFIPEYKGRENFKGEVLHSHAYRKSSVYEGKKVIVVGLGSSAIDVACEVGPIATQLTIVNRRGAWVLPRFVLGKPTEAWDSRSSQTWLPTSVQEWLFEKILEHAVGKMPPELQPDHSIMAQNATLRSDFIEKLQTGVFSLRRSTIASFTETGVILANGDSLEADVVILATGYHIVDQPYLPPGALASKEAPAPQVDLYKLVVSPTWKDLYVMGQTEQAGPVTPVSEAQARYIAAVIKGSVQLPSEEDMMRDIRALRVWQKKHMIDSDRHALTVDFVRYMDGLLAPLGAAPTFGKLFGRIFTSGKPLRAWNILSAVYFGIPAPAQWRLFGEGSTPVLAEETLLRTDANTGELSEGEKSFL
ncbi:hypothetical protein CORC01_07142 [Colletotrichum orchidophilum]|uniref:Flavin-containing monooxygenase 1 n=1 Tax=Colletotrichum orchidophilum TaxID=1209926 RepID=A0A1G4B7Y6_9PEZI|nr:uncharacterized protein CORC01_07142 [Colletotrichum orchidophilum]OHE97527.1 hypothetical protein CORC01_07142 [Colletotrichum orchidophilum]